MNASLEASAAPPRIRRPPVPMSCIDFDNPRYAICQGEPDLTHPPKFEPVLETEPEFGGWELGFGWLSHPTKCPPVAFDWRSLTPESLRAAWQKFTAIEAELTQALVELGPTKAKAVERAEIFAEKYQRASLLGIETPKPRTVPETEARWDAVQSLLESNAADFLSAVVTVMPELIGELERRADSLDAALAAIYAEVGVSGVSPSEGPFAFRHRAATLRLRSHEFPALLRSKSDYPQPDSCRYVAHGVGLLDYL